MLLAIFKGNRSAVRALLTTALTSVEADGLRIGAASATHDAVALAEAAHHLKGTSEALGAQALAAASKAIETFAKQGFPSPIDSLIQDVERESAELKVAINLFLW
jgi:HPt (histidine-containing phosphotransfer) domain-containing protein